MTHDLNPCEPREKRRSSVGSFSWFLVMGVSLPCQQIYEVVGVHELLRGGGEQRRILFPVEGLCLQNETFQFLMEIHRRERKTLESSK